MPTRLLIAALALFPIATILAVSEQAGDARPATSPRDDRPEDQRYRTFWLTPDGENHGYGRLLIIRQSLPTLVDLDLETDGYVLDAFAITIDTYRRVTVWNDDRRPIKSVGELTNLDEQARTVTIGDARYTYEECPPADAATLLENPEGVGRRVLLHRPYAPLSGAERTARSLARLIRDELAEQDRADEAESDGSP